MATAGLSALFLCFSAGGILLTQDLFYSYTELKNVYQLCSAEFSKHKALFCTLFFRSK